MQSVFLYVIMNNFIFITADITKLIRSTRVILVLGPSAFGHPSSLHFRCRSFTLQTDMSDVLTVRASMIKRALWKYFGLESQTRSAASFWLQLDSNPVMNYHKDKHKRETLEKVRLLTGIYSYPHLIYRNKNLFLKKKKFCGHWDTFKLCLIFTSGHAWAWQ